MTTKKELKKLERQWRDRFGPPHQPVENLLACTELKIAAAHAGVQVIEIKEGKLMLTRGGDYILVDGKFPRLEGKTNRDRLFHALQLLHTLMARA